MFEGKLLTYILLAIIAFLGWTVVDEKYINPAEVRTTTDTVYVDKPFKVETVVRGDEIISPTVTMWETEVIEVAKIELVDDTVEVFVDSSSSNPIQYNTAFLTNYTNAPKFLELSLEEDQLEFTGMKPNGETVSSKWPLDLARNDYRMAPNGNGWVGLEADRAHRFFGLDFGLSHSLGLGAEWRMVDDQINQFLYIEYLPSVQIKQNISLEGAVGVSSNPYGSLGVEYEF